MIRSRFSARCSRAAAAPAYSTICSAPNGTIQAGRSAAPTCVTTWRFLRRSGVGLRQGNSGHEARSVRVVSRLGRGSGSATKSCSTCGGRGQVISSRGIFSIAQTCPRCGGAGRVIEKPCAHVTAPGVASGRPTSKSGFRRESTPARDCARRATAKAAYGRAGGKSLRRFARQTHEIFQRDGDDLICEVPISLCMPRWARRLKCPPCPKGAHQNSAGTQAGTVFRLKGKGVRNVQGMARAICTCGFTWRCPRTSTRATDEAAGICRNLRSQRQPAEQKLL